MAKYFGKIGFAVTRETKPGVWEEQIIEKEFYGDVNRISRRLQSAESLNDNVIFSNEISIVSNPFANENFHSIRYAEYMGVKWKVTNVDVNYPRLNLSIGEVYNV